MHLLLTRLNIILILMDSLLGIGQSSLVVQKLAMDYIRALVGWLMMLVVGCLLLNDNYHLLYTIYIIY
jgi:hypothetical protein